MENSPDGYEEEEFNDEMTKEMIDQIINQAEQADNEMNTQSLKNILTSLNEKIKINKNLRQKYPNVPDKYLNSEIELHEEIKVLQRIAAYPNLINDFVENEGIELLINLLNHPNVDIVDDAVTVK
jgi:beta-catenin-like protein 1